MKKISYYEEYISENKITELLTESKINYRPSFVKILKNIKDNRIALELLDLQNKDIDVKQDNIKIGDKNDVILFTPIKNSNTNTKYILVSNTSIVGSPRTYDELVPNWRDYRCTINMDVGTTGKILLTRGNLSFFVSDVVHNDGRINACLLPTVDLELYLTPVSISVGRFVNKLLRLNNINFTTKELEDFVNKFKSQYDIEFNSINLKLLKGKEILNGYLYTNYSNPRKGTIWSSCMRYDKCQNYLDIYTDNENVQLLVLLDPDDKIKGRAIVWKLESGKFFMDRIYTIDDSDVNIFINFAKENNWIYKKSQNSSVYDISDGTLLSSVLYENDTDLSFLLSMEYPYMDTMCLLSDTGYISNSKEYILSICDKFYLELRNTDGEYYKKNV